MFENKFYDAIFDEKNREIVKFQWIFQLTFSHFQRANFI